MAYQLDTRRRMLVIILAVVGIACAWILEETKVYRKAAGYESKKRATDLATEAYTTLHDYYVNDLGRRIDTDADPAQSGLIGPRYSAISNARGNMAEKRTSLNPNFAAVIVDYFREIGLKKGDLVAVALSGSFPGMNVNVYAALQALELQPIVVTAIAGSSWGAIDPEFTWLDMERVLDEKGVLHIRSTAASPGGRDDMGNSLSPEGQRLIDSAIRRNGIPALTSTNLDESIQRRMEAYWGKAAGRKIKAYVNVGGGIASLGSSLRDVPIRSGLYFDLWKVNFPRAGTLVQMAKSGVPVIHLGAAQEVAEEYGLSVAPRYMPEPGEGSALGGEGYSVTVAAALLVFYLLLTFVLVLPEFRRRFLKLGTPSNPSPAAPMAQQ